MVDPKHPNSLKKAELVRIVVALQEALFEDGDGPATWWTLEKDVSGSDLIMDMSNLLDEYGLAPREEENDHDETT